MNEILQFLAGSLIGGYICTSVNISFTLLLSGKFTVAEAVYWMFFWPTLASKTVRDRFR